MHWALLEARTQLASKLLVSISFQTGDFFCITHTHYSISPPDNIFSVVTGHQFFGTLPTLRPFPKWRSTFLWALRLIRRTILRVVWSKNQTEIQEKICIPKGPKYEINIKWEGGGGVWYCSQLKMKICIIIVLNMFDTNVGMVFLLLSTLWSFTLLSGPGDYDDEKFHLIDRILVNRTKEFSQEKETQLQLLRWGLGYLNKYFCIYNYWL